RNNMSVLMAHLHQTPPPMSEANPKVKIPPRVERLVMSCLERDPDLRPHNARELAEQFRAAIADHPQARPEPRPRSLLAAGLAAIALVVIGTMTIGGLVVYRRPLPDPVRHPTPGEGSEKGRTGPPVGNPPGVEKNPGEASGWSAWRSLGYEPLTAKHLEALA